MVKHPSHSQNKISDDDRELLSTYLDDQLDSAVRAQLEQRLAADGELQSELAELRATIHMLRTLAPVAAPRSFALPPQHVAARPPFWAGLLRLAQIAVVLIVGLTITSMFAFRPLQFAADSGSDMARTEFDPIQPALSNEAEDMPPDIAGSSMAATEAPAEAAESGATIQEAAPTQEAAVTAEAAGPTEPYTYVAPSNPPAPAEASGSLPPRTPWLGYVLLGATVIILLGAGGLWIVLRQRR